MDERQLVCYPKSETCSLGAVSLGSINVLLVRQSTIHSRRCFLKVILQNRLECGRESSVHC